MSTPACSRAVAYREATRATTERQGSRRSSFPLTAITMSFRPSPPPPSLPPPALSATAATPHYARHAVARSWRWLCHPANTAARTREVRNPGRAGGRVVGYAKAHSRAGDSGERGRSFRTGWWWKARRACLSAMEGRCSGWALRRRPPCPRRRPILGSVRAALSAVAAGGS